MEVHDKLDEITRYVEEARAMPMSASALVNRADLLLSDRDAVVAQGRQEAEQLLNQAQVEHDRLVEQTEVVAAARQRAAQVQSQAQAEATRLLAEADDYVDRKLGEFEVTLDKLVQQVQRGRQHLADRAAADRAHGLTADADLATLQDDAERADHDVAGEPRDARNEGGGPSSDG